ncbi:MAG: hypothetical protein GVY18_17170 [Bacteroidetes bacterium]|nr:hypothetical protein [Bacteroidota bacterium]
MKGTYYEHGQFYRGSRTKVTNDGEPFARSLTNEDPVKTHDDERKEHIKRIAQVRQEEFQARHKVMHGQSSSPGLQAGWRFKLMDHYRSDIDEKQYLVTSVQHEGAQRGQIPGLGALEEVGYGNSFSCILEGIQYRPPRETPKPKIPGIMTASVESEDGSDDPPNIDEEGRYRVRLPFDLRDQGGGPDPDMADLGKASAPLSMGQPYTGPDYGMHFPNRAGTKMIFACMEGDPDQPVGLSTLPTPWNHTPVPNNKLMMPTQNGVELDFDGDGDKEFSFGSAASFSTTEGGWQPGTMGGKQTFDERKAVIRTRRGHQLVMDDNDASGNVGITLQVGKSDSEGGFGLTQNWFWNSRVDMGGYKKKTSLEQVLDTASFAGEWLGVLASSFGDVPGLAGAVAGAMGTQAVTGDYLADSLGDTNPVGVAINTDRSVDIQGQDGVNIVSPNILGVLGGGMIPGLNSQGAHRLLWAFTNFLINTVYNGVVKAGAQKYRKYQKYKADPENAASHWYWQYRMDQKAEFAKDLINSIIQRPGINLKSAGEIKGFAWDDVNWAAGLGSVNLNAGDEINFNADGDMNVEAGQGISIHTAGLKKTKLTASIAENIKTFFGKALPAPLQAIGGRLEVESEDPAGVEKRMDNFPISIHNEYGNVQAFTDWKHILLRAAKGRVQLAAMTNAVEVLSGDQLYMATGAMGKVKDEDADTGEAEWKSWQIDKDKLTTEIIASHEEESITMDAGNEIHLSVGEMQSSPRETMKWADTESTFIVAEPILYGFNKKMVVFNVGDDPKDMKSRVIITPDEVNVAVGSKSVFTIDSSGKVVISGQNVEINAQSSFKVNASTIEMNASATATYAGSMINHKAGMIKQGKGAGKPAKPAKPPKDPKVKQAKKPKSKKNPAGGGGGGI